MHPTMKRLRANRRQLEAIEVQAEKLRQERNLLWAEARRAGFNVIDIAEESRVTPGRVSQIIGARRPTKDEQ